MEDHQRKIGRALLALRKARSWSQEDAAHAVGVTVSTWGDWERGKHNPTDANWRKIEQAFGVDAVEIRGEPAAPLFAIAGAGRADVRQQLARIENKLDEIAARQRTLIEAVEAPSLAKKIPSSSRR